MVGFNRVHQSASGPNRIRLEFVEALSAHLLGLGGGACGPRQAGLGVRPMVHAIISWSLHNRLIVILGVIGLVRRGRLLGRESERRGLSRPHAAARRGHRPESRGEPRGDGAARLPAAGNRPQWDAGPRSPPEHVHRGSERYQVPVRLRHRLPGGEARSHQPHRHGRPSLRASSPAFLPGARPGRLSATSSKARATRRINSRPFRIGC